MDWQPIETAPKGESYILVGWAGKPYISIARWNDDRYNKKPRPFWKIVGSLSVMRDSASQPTHWMPLPPPPLTKD